MKLFISWSGEFSQKVAEKLSIWIPTIIQSVDAFYSPDDIAKGENWGKRLDEELNECSFGIICLTPENVAAPWIHFEAGALSRTLNSRLSALMLNVNPSDLKGPLTRYQNTDFEREDFFRLFQSINNASDTPLRPDILKNAFDNAWEKLEKEIGDIIRTHAAQTMAADGDNDNRNDSDAIQEILRLLRRANNNRTERPQRQSAFSVDDVNVPAVYHVNFALNNASIEDVLPLIENYLLDQTKQNRANIRQSFATSEAAAFELYVSQAQMEAISKRLLSMGVGVVSYGLR